ncbi:hypothetical protein BofuT4_uP007260.1 [Botrytis cinerea T4]|uniref:Uncharacterized protein n=1 Tax=Botryotinia fuckeliana (strain T4) TaxID=999810 RepID=G2XXH0_BOTF4|nr:hypothetical protein BofuT4_uP007260.1 [Botrytis cinerea T4]
MIGNISGSFERKTGFHYCGDRMSMWGSVCLCGDESYWRLVVVSPRAWYRFMWFDGMYVMNGEKNER